MFNEEIRKYQKVLCRCDIEKRGKSVQTVTLEFERVF